MDCGFNINHILPEEITVLDASADFWKNTSVGGGREFMRQQICTVIDRIGEGSAQSQGFLNPITTSQKLRASDHRLYILKDANANQYRGGVIGYIKVARKKLVIQDQKGQQKQYEPLCLLDFFIDPAYQRQGHGQKLCNFVLKDILFCGKCGERKVSWFASQARVFLETSSFLQEDHQREHVQPQDIAIDRPSQKCLSFFSHKFNLTDTVRQSTPFVVFAEFFNTNNPGDIPELDTQQSKTSNGPMQKTYNGFYTGPQKVPPQSINTEELSTVNGDYGRTLSNGSNGNYHNGSSDKPSPTENGMPSPPIVTAEMVKEKQAAGNMQTPDPFRNSLRPTKGANMHYTHTQLW